MTYATVESSVQTGRPVELYEFLDGATAYRYTSAEHRATMDSFAANLKRVRAELKAKGVATYSLEVVDKGTAGDKPVVGSCEAGSKEITYTRG